MDKTLNDDYIVEITENNITNQSMRTIEKRALEKASDLGNRWVAPDPKMIDELLNKKTVKKGYFRVVIDDEACNPDKVSEIKCEVITQPDSAKVPEELREFYVKVQGTISVIKAMKMPEKEIGIKQNYVIQLLNIARLGLMGENPQTALAESSLNLLKEEIMMREAGKIKNRHFSKLGISALLISLVCIALAFFFDYLSEVEESFNLLENNMFAPYLFTFAAAVVGTWVGFGVKKKTLIFKDLAVMNEDRLNPFLKLLFVGVVAIFLLLFIQGQIVTFTIGGITSAEIFSKTELQVLLGAIAGLLGNNLAQGLYDKANDSIVYDKEEK